MGVAISKICPLQFQETRPSRRVFYCPQFHPRDRSPSSEGFFILEVSTHGWWWQETQKSVQTETAVMYFVLLGVGLFLAALLNGNSARSLLLVYLTCGVILLLPEALPDPDLLGGTWFSLLIAVEIAFASLALLIQAPMSKVVAVLGCWNVVCHTGAMAALAGNWSAYVLYDGLIRGGEVSQVLALIVFSEPFKRLAFAIVDRTKKDSGGGQFRTWFQLA